MKDDNIILFPKMKKKVPRQTKVQKKAIADALTQDLIDNVSTDIIDYILLDLQESGIAMMANKKDIGLLIEATKSLVSRHYDQPHFLHKLANNIFDENSNGAICLNETVNFNFHKTQSKA
jgi:hypothetical protein